MASKEEKSSKTIDGDAAQLQELYELMESEGLDSLELKDEESSIRLVRRHAMPTVVHAPAASLVVPASVSPASVEPGVSGPPNAQSISTPLAGVFYRASSPTSAAFVKEGDVVDSGQTLCIVEAMKLMNEIKAESHCRIVKIAAENARPVTAGQPLFWVEPV